MGRTTRVIVDNYHSAKIREHNEVKVEAITNAIILKGFSPYIENGTWWVYDNDTHLFIDTGVVATGEKGADGLNGKDGIDGRNGEKGDKGDKGEKGDPFKYSDFTPEQLESLKVKGDKGDKGDAGDSYVISEQDYEAIANIAQEGLKPLIDNKMEYLIITFNGSAFISSGKTLTYSEIKELCLDTTHFVYAQYSNRLYIPQYISNNNIFFESTYIQSDKPTMHRIAINNLNQVSQYNYDIAKESDIPSDTHINNLIDAKLGVIENGSY